jgi:Ca2+-binding EF-hand superfamily protein
MRPVNFSMFVRLVTGKQNLFFEMDTFHRVFDRNNNGVVDLDEFKEGVHTLEEKDPQHCVLVGLRAFVGETLMSL